MKGRCKNCGCAGDHTGYGSTPGWCPDCRTYSVVEIRQSKPGPIQQKPDDRGDKLRRMILTELLNRPEPLPREVSDAVDAFTGDWVLSLLQDAGTERARATLQAKEEPA